MKDGDLHQRLISRDARLRDAAWDDLLTRLVPRIDRRVDWRLRNAPPHVRQSLQDISNDVMLGENRAQMRNTLTKSLIYKLGLPAGDPYGLGAPA